MGRSPTKNLTVDFSKAQNVGCVRVVNGGKADSFVEACRLVVLGAQADAMEVRAGVVHEGGYERSANAFVSPRRAHVDASDASGVQFVDKRVMGESAYGDQKTLIEISAEDLSGRVEAVLSACPLVQQLIDEAMALVARFCAQDVHSGDRQPDLLYRDHGSILVILSGLPCRCKSGAKASHLKKNLDFGLYKFCI
jgi:hypothetical protein